MSSGAMNRPPSSPLFCIFGIEFPELSKSTVSPLTLQLIDPFWTFGEFVQAMRSECLRTIREPFEGGGGGEDETMQTFVQDLAEDHVRIVEIRINTCRGVPKAIYYDLVVLYYDERRIGDHFVNDYALSEHTIVQIYVEVRKEPIHISSSISNGLHRYQSAPVSTRVRALVRLRLVQAWQAAYSKYGDCRIRHVMHPHANRENDFTRIGTVVPLRYDLRRLALSMDEEAARGDMCVLQVLAYDKLSQLSGWFDLVIALHCTLRRCKERVVEAIRQVLDWSDATIDELPHLIARRYNEGQAEDFLLCDDTMTLSYVLTTAATTTVKAEEIIIDANSPRRPSTVVPLLTVIAFVGRRGRRVSDSKGRCVFDEEEHGTQLLVAAMSVYLNNILEKSHAKSMAIDFGQQTQQQAQQQQPQSNETKVDKEVVKKQLQQHQSDHQRKASRLLKKERRMSLRAKTSRQASRTVSQTSGVSNSGSNAAQGAQGAQVVANRSKCARCVIM